MGAFESVLLKSFSATKRRPREGVRYLRRWYPRLYEAMLREIEDGRCPFCGLRVRRRFAFSGHMLSSACRGSWFEFVRMIMGRGRVSEEEALEYVNRVRWEHGLPPLTLDGAQQSSGSRASRSRWQHA